MMKVLYLLNFAGKAGTERYVETLVKYLGGKEIEPYFAYNQGGLLVERLQELNVPCRQLTMDSRFDFKAAKALAKLCEEWDIDLVHTHYLRENYIALLAKRYNKKIRSVYTNHFVLENNLITRISNKMLDGKQDRMIAVCNRGKEQLVANGWSREKIDVVFNGVDLTAWAGEGSNLREELGIPAERFTMLCASRFAHDKGHAYLMRSLAKLKEISQTPFTMVLAGDGELLEPTKALASELGLTEEDVKFIGFRKDMKNLFKGVDLYVNPSEHEALSFLIIEALAAGLPAAITDMGGNSDILQCPDQGGLLVKYDDPDDTAAALKRFLEKPEFRALCAENAVKNIQARFEIHDIARTTYGVYEKAVQA